MIYATLTVQVAGSTSTTLYSCPVRARLVGILISMGSSLTTATSVGNNFSQVSIGGVIASNNVITNNVLAILYHRLATTAAVDKDAQNSSIFVPQSLVIQPRQDIQLYASASANNTMDTAFTLFLEELK